MSSIVADLFSDLHPKMLGLSGERERKSLAEAEWRRRIGRLIERALELAGMTKQEISFEMGYADQSAVSRWISATERPLFDKLFTVDRFRVAYLVAMAEGEPSVEVTQQITLRRTV